MPLTVAQLTAFWTGPAQMGLSARTRTQIAAEGLTTPDDFEDFNDEADLEGLFRLLLKPPKVTAVGYVNNTIIARRIKSLEMRLNWLKCRESQDQFRIFWDKGSHNLADYHTKHHPPEYHIAHRHSHAG